MEMNMVEVVDSKEALLRLGSKLEKFYETDDGGIGCCPVHEDSTPSLKLTWKDEKVLEPVFTVSIEDSKVLG